VQAMTDAERISALEKELRVCRKSFKNIDQLLEDEFGGFYLSAPKDTPLDKVKGIIKEAQADD
jgi:hypothetical protein